jgi:very-short-patch-repair endonuclease
MTTDRSSILGHAAQQFGLFTTDQGAANGLTLRMLQQWRDRGGIIRLDRRVWGVQGAPDTLERRALAAVLRHESGAALCRRSAAWLWRLPGRLPEPFDVAKARGERPLDHQHLHSSRLFEACDITERRGIPVTTPVRTVFDLAGRQHPERTRKDLNDLMGRGLVTLGTLDDTLERLARRGRTGIKVMRELIADARAQGVPAGSNLELVVEDILDAAGLRDMERQVPIYDDEGFIARVDFGDRHRRIAVEVDSDRFHHGLLDRRMDAEKTSRLKRCNWVVVRIIEREVWWERQALIARLRKLLWSTTPRLADGAA